MGLSIRNPETAALARKVAHLKGKGITETLHELLQRESEALTPAPENKTVLGATEVFWERAGLTGKHTETLPKSFYDDLWGQGDD